MKISFFNRFQIPLFVLGGVVVLGLIFSSERGDASGVTTPDQCCRCHQEVCEQSAIKRYVHAPVLENHCAVCHVTGAMAAIDSQVVDEEAQGEIEWFARDSQENNEHWFELPPQLAGTNISLMAKAGRRNVLQQEVELPSLDNAPQFPLPQGGAKISELRVAEVKKGVFLSARVAWKTDRITDAQIFYGEGRLSSSTALDNRWATGHEIIVTGLEAGRNYTFVAVSYDIYGNKTMSRKMNFSTQDFYSEPVLQSKGGLEQIEMQASFYQGEGRFFARFATSHPVTMRLGRNDAQSLMVKGNGLEANRPEDHLALTDPHSLTITVCVNCHPQSKGVHSHPVGIRPKAGMNIPSDYQMMADGRLSCMSCHQAHASDNEYRLTRAKRKDLCLGCHRNFG